jgi:hypothetical protein
MTINVMIAWSYYAKKGFESLFGKKASPSSKWDTKGTSQDAVDNGRCGDSSPVGPESLGVLRGHLVPGTFFGHKALLAMGIGGSKLNRHA